MTHKCQRKTEPNSTDCGNKTRPNAFRRASRTALLQLLGIDRDFGKPLSIQGETCNVGFITSNYYSYVKEIETALLEAERKKAEALMEWQKHRLIC